MFTTDQPLPSTSTKSKSRAAAAAGFQHPLKGVQGGHSGNEEALCARVGNGLAGMTGLQRVRYFQEPILRV